MCENSKRQHATYRTDPKRILRLVTLTEDSTHGSQLNAITNRCTGAMALKVPCFAEALNSSLSICLQDCVPLGTSGRLSDSRCSTRAMFVSIGSSIEKDETDLLEEVPRMTALILSPSRMASLSLLMYTALVPSPRP